MTDPSSFRALPRTVWLLSLCNGWLFVGNSLLITVSALIGLSLADDKRLATLPLALQFLAILCSTVPASLLMGRIGRKPGFLLAGTVGLLGASIAMTAIVTERFALYCVATVCFGVVAAFGNYYRFTAAEVVGVTARPRAISLVMAGGVIAAFIGPNLANWSAGWFEARAFAGPFAALFVVYLLSMATIAICDVPGPLPRGGSGGRPLRTIAAQPLFVVAVACQALGYGVMNFVMTSTPLAMRAHAYGLGATALVIQWHVVAMFAPSFLTGSLIGRIGLVRVLALGVVLCVATVAINLHGMTMVHFVSALVLLGIGWNFLFVGGTTLLTEAYRPEERSRAQAINDLIVFSTVSLTALSAGTVHHVFGWRTVNLAVLPMLALATLAVLWLRSERRVSRASNPAMTAP